MFKFIDEKLILNKRDLVIGTFIALIMGSVFIKTGGLPLMVTFIPGLVVSLGAISYMFIKKVEFPKATAFIPIFL